jgi:hypothetical protein
MGKLKTRRRKLDWQRTRRRSKRSDVQSDEPLYIYAVAAVVCACFLWFAVPAIARSEEIILLQLWLCIG